ncbi:MAG: hypothetical protein HFH72_02470 [Lachnospiraceae bacterium]|nr:hypothetical protein [Lachnospiraceae bacterium]
MGNSTGNTIIEKLLQLKEHYKDARTYCKRTEIDDCDIVNRVCQVKCVSF